MTWLTELGEQIRQAREKAKLSQAELAKNLSVSRGQLSNYENGKCPPNVNVVTELAAALNTEFLVRGYRIGLNGAEHRTPISVPHQLCLEFDVDHRFPSATVTIRPTSDAILISAVVPRRNP